MIYFDIVTLPHLNLPFFCREFGGGLTRKVGSGGLELGGGRGLELGGGLARKVGRGGLGLAGGLGGKVGVLKVSNLNLSFRFRFRFSFLFSFLNFQDFFSFFFKTQN